MRDLVLVTVECARWDYRHHLAPDGFDATRGVAVGHYTRPSLAGLLTGRLASAVDAHAYGPTLADVFRRAGYETAAVSFSPQTTAPFGFARGFDTHHLLRADDGRLARGSAFRERLAENPIVRRVKRRLRGKHATFDGIPHDDRAAELAKDLLERNRDAALFLWVHLMGSHRPYGWNAGTLPRAPSRRAARYDGDEPVPASLAETVESYYTSALERAGRHLRALADAADDAAVVAVGDHGEELGEDGVFFHGGYRRRLVDTIVDVPILTRGLALPDGPVSLLDLPAHLAARCRVDAPASWDARTRRDHVLSVAPWADAVSLRYQADGVDLTFADADAPAMAVSEPAEANIEEQLRALGYAGVG